MEENTPITLVGILPVAHPAPFVSTTAESKNMGQGQSHPELKRRFAQTFAQDDCEFEKLYLYGKSGVLATARTKARHYLEHGLIPAETARRILLQEGPRKRIFYVRGTPYEMGFLMGQAAPIEVEALCTTYLHHIAPQFVSESFDLSMRVAPLFYQSAYEMLLGALGHLLISGTNEAFRVALEHQDIPSQYLEEMRGLVDGVASTQLVTAVTLERVIACNYGMDYLMSQIFSGELVRKMRKAWEHMDPELRKQLPDFEDRFLAVPDMCNAFVATGKATKSGDDVFLARDFQFNNAHVFHKYCTLIVRCPVERGRFSHVAVAMPGMVGHVTGYNERQVAMGVNLVRSGAVDHQRIGMGLMFLMRELAEQATSATHAESVIKKHMMGNPWLLYAVDAQSDYRCFELVARKWEDHMDRETWVAKTRPHVAKLLPPREDMAAWRETHHHSGVWSRTGEPPAATAGDRQLWEWSKPLLRYHQQAALMQPQRWKKAGRLLFQSWEDENALVNTVANDFFPPWKPVAGVMVVNNQFHNPLLRLSQMNFWATLTEQNACGNTWRYETLVAQLRQHHGQLDLDLCCDLITFLSPWKQPDYPQNVGYNAAIPDMWDVIREVVSEQVKRDTSRNDPVTATANSVVQAMVKDDTEMQPNDAPTKIYPHAVMISGSLSVVDVKQGTIAAKSGYWGSEWYQLNALRYFKPIV